MTAKVLLATVYYAAKCVGMIPFKLSSWNPDSIVQISFLSTCYVILMPIFFTTAFIWSLMVFLNPDPDMIDSTKITKVAVLKIDSYVCITRNFTVYVFVIYHRKLLVQTVNSVRRVISKFRLTFENFLDRRCQQMVLVQVLVTMTQIVIYICLTYDYIIFPPNAYTWVTILKINISTFFTYAYVSILNAVHFTAFITVVQLMRHINQRLKFCIAKVQEISRMEKRSSMRMQMYCDLSDRIDELAALHKCVKNSNRMICKVFSMSIIVALMNSFIFNMAGVIIHLKCVKL